MKFDFEVSVREGDVLKFNDHAWQVDDIESDFGIKKVWLKPMTGAGEYMCLEHDDLESRISSSGEFRLIKKSYMEVFDY